MAGSVQSPEQRSSLDRVVAALKGIGYTSDLIRERYSFEDWFEPDAPERAIEVAAFAQKPLAYDTACLAVAVANGTQGIPLLRQVRALGAPRCFEIAHDGRVFHWRVSENPSAQDRQWEIQANEIEAVFAANGDRWSPDAIFSQRRHPAPAQRDFIDLGLIPALEEHVREKLAPRLEDILRTTTEDIEARTGRPPNLTTLFRLIFRGIAGKVFRDRKHPAFKRFNRHSPPDELFAKVADHYGEKSTEGDRFTKKLIYDALWSGFGLGNLSVDVLAFLYEDFLVTPHLRETRGIHATRPSVARYVVNHLPLEDVPAGRMVVEPCCGGAAFLVAGLQRFRQLLPRTTRQVVRHEYARSRLFGADLDAFALEVARCSLMLSDYPNRNGWQLEKENVFGDSVASPNYHEALSRAKIVLCNPPFEDIEPEDRRAYGTTTPRAPAELILRVLDLAPRDACLGFVLPTQAVDGKSYAGVREQLARRFADLELVHLPDDAFKHAEMPAVLVLARQPRQGGSTTRVTSGTVLEMAQFERTGVPQDQFVATRTVAEASKTLDATRFWEAWKKLGVGDNAPTLKAHRGVEWKSAVPMADRVSLKPRPGYRPGYHFTDEIALYEAPRLVYLNESDEVKDRNAWDLPWDQPKALLNRARTSRGPWRLATFPVERDAACSENFVAIWAGPEWPATVLSAVLNGPVASAFVATHDRYIDHKTTTLSRVPLPTLSPEAKRLLDELVRKYIAMVVAYRHQQAVRAKQLAKAESAGLFTRRPKVPAEPSADPLRELLLEIDATVLAAYNLPPPVERDIVNFFRGYARPLPFGFEDYETRLIRRRLDEQSHALDEDEDEQRTTWTALRRMLDEDRLSSRKLFK